MDDPVAVSANVTVGGLTFQLSLNSSAFIGELNITRSDFPCDFIFGVGTSAAQVHVKRDLYMMLNFSLVINQ